jgi:hypothetical protein
MNNLEVNHRYLVKYKVASPFNTGKPYEIHTLEVSSKAYKIKVLSGMDTGHQSWYEKSEFVRDYELVDDLGILE